MAGKPVVVSMGVGDSLRRLLRSLRRQNYIVASPGSTLTGSIGTFGVNTVEKQPVVDWRTQRRRFHLAAGGYFR